ncbi:MAG: hypothetical protein OER95_11015 [Acidimicrobiia bacterium]|nr:hypothetical protein [Acidimicrobiia bacterium]
MTTNSNDILAWTTKDGVTRPPAGIKPAILGGTALAMTGIWIGLLSVDTLCPEHRAWVEALATGALVASGAAIVGLLRQRSWSATFALLSAGLGIAIGVIDAVHDPTRGALIAIGFTAVAAVLALTVVRQFRGAAWARRAAAELDHRPEVPADTADSATATADPVTMATSAPDSSTTSSV